MRKRNQFTDQLWTTVERQLSEGMRDRISDDVRDKVHDDLWSDLSYPLYRQIEIRLIGGLDGSYYMLS